MTYAFKRLKNIDKRRNAEVILPQLLLFNALLKTSQLPFHGIVIHRGAGLALNVLSSDVSSFLLADPSTARVRTLGSLSSDDE